MLKYIFRYLKTEAIHHPWTSLKKFFDTTKQVMYGMQNRIYGEKLYQIIHLIKCELSIIQRKKQMYFYKRDDPRES